MISPSSRVLDLGRLKKAGQWQKGTFIYSGSRLRSAGPQDAHLIDHCKTGRLPPLTPTELCKVLVTKQFTNGSDTAFVVKCYARTYYELIACSTTLALSSLKWQDAQLQKLTHSFAFMKRLVG